ncbi:MAG: Lrp/AsnC family transcriptional regulator [Alphaproteobacteria bacterium]|nr:Lrp/AsnC family transcriptional regulator [Alphaproteobacteria bacterium]
MDEIDHRLVALLRADARTPATALARAVKLSRGAVQNRLERLLARGDISGFTVKVRDGTPGSGVRAVMSIAVEGRASEAVLQALRGLPQIEAVHTTNGRWDMVAEIRADSLEVFSQTLDAIRLIQGVQATETSLLLKTHRF